MNKLVLTRKGAEVYFGEKKLTIITQSTKGPGHEVVKIDGLPNTNGKKFVSLSTLKEGDNELTCTARDVTIRAAGGKQYQLTPEEAATVASLQKQIDAIIDAAKKRYVPRPNLNVDPSKLSEADREKLLNDTLRYLELLKSM